VRRGCAEDVEQDSEKSRHVDPFSAFVVFARRHRRIMCAVYINLLDRFQTIIDLVRAHIMIS